MGQVIGQYYTGHSVSGQWVSRYMGEFGTAGQ